MDTTGKNEENLGYFRILEKELSCEKHRPISQKVFRNVLK